MKRRDRSSLAALRGSVAAALRALPGTSRAFGPPRRSVFDTPAWAEGAGAAGRVQALSARRETRRAAPRHADPAIARRFAAMAAGSVKARFVAELADGRHWGRGFGSAIDRDDALHHDLSPAVTDFTGGPHDTLRQPWLPRVRRIGGSAAVVGGAYAENFHHWLLDTLPRCGLLREAGLMEGVEKFILPAGAVRPWHRETLALLGIGADRTLWLGPRDHVECGRLIVPSGSEPGREPERYDYTPEGLKFVRELVLPRAAGLAGRGARIVVSRERAGARRLCDGEAAHARLARAGFTKVLLEELSVVEQAACFARADVVVFPTGGNLANLVFCRPGTRVVELFDPAYLPTFSLPLTQALGLEYHALVGEPTGGETEHSDAGGRCDIAVPVERILEHAA